MQQPLDVMAGPVPAIHAHARWMAAMDCRRSALRAPVGNDVSQKKHF